MSNTNTFLAGNSSLFLVWVVSVRGNLNKYAYLNIFISCASSMEGGAEHRGVVPDQLRQVTVNIRYKYGNITFTIKAK